LKLRYSKKEISKKEISKKEISKLAKFYVKY